MIPKKTKYTSELRYDNRTVSLINLTNEFTEVKKVSYGTVITVNFEFIKTFITSDEGYLIFRIPHKTLDKIFAPVMDVGSLFYRINSLIQSPMISENTDIQLESMKQDFCHLKLTRLKTFRSNG